MGGAQWVVEKIMREDRPGTERVAAFSDGVIAIIITIMVLELKLPEHMADHSIWGGILQPVATRLSAYVLSFFVVAVMWGNHHAILRTAPYVSPGLLWANAHLLFWMSLIPFTTHLLGEGPRYPGHVAVYGFVLFASAVGFALLRLVIVRQVEGAEHAPQSHHRGVLRRSWLGIALYVASMPLAYWSVWASLAIFCIVPVVFYLPGLFRRGGASPS